MNPKESHVAPQPITRTIKEFAADKNGSVHDEAATYSQRGVFQLESYKLTQRGPSFPGAEISFDRKSGRYQAKTRERTDGPEETASGEFEMPGDLYNGMALLVLKNKRIDLDGWRRRGFRGRLLELLAIPFESAL